jgi:hypothetical protein
MRLLACLIAISLTLVAVANAGRSGGQSDTGAVKARATNASHGATALVPRAPRLIQLQRFRGPAPRDLRQLPPMLPNHGCMRYAAGRQGRCLRRFLPECNVRPLGAGPVRCPAIRLRMVPLGTRHSPEVRP